MGLFTRRARPVDANTATAAGTDTTPVTGTATTREKTPRAGGGFMGMLRGRHNGTYPETRNSRPTFGQWFKQTWIDIVTMIVLGAIGLGVSSALKAWKEKTAYRAGDLSDTQCHTNRAIEVKGWRKSHQCRL
jgi:diacylglycerol diphosphate phosphatase/phosphatidate phosphatase